MVARAHLNKSYRNNELSISARLFGGPREIITLVLSLFAISVVVKYCRTTLTSVTDDNKLILVWVPFFGDPYFNFGDGSPQIFKEAGCNYTDCKFVKNRRPEPLERYDAILFHGYEFYDMFFGVPARRNPKQLYVFMSLESSIRCSIPSSYRDFYNYTMTYRLDSDIPWPYFQMVDRKTGREVAPSANPHWEVYNGEVSPEVRKLLAEKERDVAWFVSNCNSVSGRERLARQLQEAGLQVDIYGKCGNLKCPVGDWDACLQKLRKYRFYLAFENSLCEDYVTEKSVNALSGGAVPVVLSGANLTRFLPPGSYVDVQGGVHGADLARVLRKLSTPEEYVKLHSWRMRYRVVRRGPGFEWASGKHPFCDLCARLHQTSVVNIQDVSHWWSHNAGGAPVCKQLD